MLHYLKNVFGITPPFDNVLFMRDQVVLIVPACLLFNGSIQMLLLSKSYTTSMYWLPWDNLIGKHLVKSAYPRSFGVKGVRTAQHSCVSVGSWSVNESSNDSSFLIGYACVDYFFSFLVQDVRLLWWWALAYAVKLWLSWDRAIQENCLFNGLCKNFQSWTKTTNVKILSELFLYIFLQIVAFVDCNYWISESYGNGAVKGVSQNPSIWFISW